MQSSCHFSPCMNMQSIYKWTGKIYKFLKIHTSTRTGAATLSGSGRSMKANDDGVPFDE